MCDYKWKPIGDKTPPYCPKCESVLWNREAKDNRRKVDKGEIRRFYLEGNSINEVALLLNIDSGLVWRRVKEMGIMRPRSEALALKWRRKKAEKELVPVG